jgi:hypothetical protein
MARQAVGRGPWKSSEGMRRFDCRFVGLRIPEAQPIAGVRIVATVEVKI